MKTLLIIFQLIPLLLDVIKSIETFIPESGKGPEKLAMVREIIENTYEGACEIWPTIERVITVAVGTANKTGAFNEKKAPVVIE